MVTPCKEEHLTGFWPLDIFWVWFMMYRLIDALDLSKVSLLQRKSEISLFDEAEQMGLLKE